jgi:hypothetical protein
MSLGLWPLLKVRFVVALRYVMHSQHPRSPCAALRRSPAKRGASMRSTAACTGGDHMQTPQT